MLKRFITAACVAFALAVIYSVIPFQANCSAIYNDVFRLHILANSDSESDQALKLKVRDKVLETTKELFNSAESKEQAERLVSENLQTIANTAYREVLNNVHAAIGHIRRAAHNYRQRQGAQLVVRNVPLAVRVASARRGRKTRP